MKLTDILKQVADGATILQWLLIGYLFYSINPEISFILFFSFAIGIISKVIILREEEREDALFIKNIKERIAKENEEFEKSFDNETEK